MFKPRVLLSLLKFFAISNSVHFASLIEVVAAHTAENESPQVLALFSLRKPRVYFCVFSVGPRGKSDRINLAKPASSVFMLSHMAGLGPPYFRYFFNKPRKGKKRPIVFAISTSPCLSVGNVIMFVFFTFFMSDLVVKAIELFLQNRHRLSL